MDTDSAELKKRNRKRTRTKKESKSEKRTDDTAVAGKNGLDNTKSKKIKSNPLNGLVLAISTLESNGSAFNSKSGTSSEITSYKKVCSLCEMLGASITGQVHKKVFAVICNKSAILQLTQRVRKALKKFILIIDVEWIFRCKREGLRVAHEEYLLIDLAKEVVAKRQIVEDSIEKRNVGVAVKHESDEELLMNTDVGWSEPVSLDCCCVCHDDDRDDCKWCCGEVRCNVISKKLSMIKS